MLKSLRNISLALSALAIILSGGCSQESLPDIDPTTQEDLALKINVDINFGKNITRADKGPEKPGPEPLPASEFEKIATLRVIIFAPDGETVIGNRMVKMDENMKPIDDNLIFSVTSQQLLSIYLIANESALTLPAGITANSVSSWLNSFKLKEKYAGLVNALNNWTTGFSQTNATASLFQNSEDAHLPITEKFMFMTDKTKAQLMNQPEEGDTNNSLKVEYLQTAKLFITPAAVKVTYRFDLSDFQGSGSQITGVRISGLSQNEFVFPSATIYSESKYAIKDNKEQIGIINDDADNQNRYITSFVIPSNNSVSSMTNTFVTAVPLKKTTDVIARGAYYFPESLSTKNQDAYTVQVQLDNATWLTAKPLKDNIQLINGVEGISRSTHLYVDIKFNNELDLTWVAIEAPYNTVDLKPGFGKLDGGEAIQ